MVALVTYPIVETVALWATVGHDLRRIDNTALWCVACDLYVTVDVQPVEPTVWCEPCHDGPLIATS